MSNSFGSSGQSVRRQMMSFFVPTESTSNWVSNPTQDRRKPALEADTTAKTTHQESYKSQTDTPFIKVQRKGSPQTCYLPISLVQTYENFLACLQHTFHNPSFITPEIVTFEGVLISDAWTYRQHLRPGLHLIIYFPLAISEESPSAEVPPDEESLSFEWVQDLGSPFTSIEGGSPSQGGVSTIDPSQVTLTNIHPHADMHHRIRKRTRRAEKPLNFQPPSLSFYPLSKVPIAVTLSNSLIRKTAFCFIKPEDNGEFFTEEASGWAGTASDTSSLFANIWWRFLDRNWPFGNEGADSSSRPQPRDPSSWSLVQPILTRPVPEGTFPLTTFDVFAQGSRRQIVCSVTWDAMAHPSGQISLANGQQEQGEISWDLGDVVNSEVDPAARTVHWVNYAPPSRVMGGSQNDEELQNESLQYTKFTSSSAASRRKSGRFWMLHPPRLLPASFFPTERQMGPEDIHFHLPHSNQLLGLLFRAYKALGFPEDKLTEITQYWQNLLPTIEARSPNGVVVKFLTRKEVSKIFPVEIEPMPADFLRAFAVVWTLRSNAAWEIEQEEAEELRLGKIVEAICTNGKSPRGVSLEGFKVLEWGGIVLPYAEGEVVADENEDGGSESGSGSDTASDRTIRAVSSSFGEEDVMMEDRACTSS